MDKKKKKTTTIQFTKEDLAAIRSAATELVPEIGSKLGDRKMVMYAIAKL